jgi:hypothetical protein
MQGGEGEAARPLGTLEEGSNPWFDDLDWPADGSMVDADEDLLSIPDPGGTLAGV